MNIVNYLVIAAWIAWSIYLIWVGLQMTINKEYRNYLTNLWFKSETEKTEKGHRLSVKYISGPLYILFGLLFLAYGIWQLDVDYGILDKSTILRSIIDSIIQ
jgi:hypothetical protein